jgi:hypothetical protein
MSAPGGTGFVMTAGRKATIWGMAGAVAANDKAASPRLVIKSEVIHGIRFTGVVGFGEFSGETKRIGRR